VKARDVMSSVSAAVEMTYPVDVAAAMMKNVGANASPVLDQAGRLVGLVTAAQLNLAWLEAELHPVRRPFASIRRRNCPTVREVMSSPAVSLTPGATLPQVADLFRDRRVDCVLIVDGLTVRGMIDRADVPAPLTPAG